MFRFNVLILFLAVFAGFQLKPSSALGMMAFWKLPTPFIVKSAVNYTLGTSTNVTMTVTAGNTLVACMSLDRDPSASVSDNKSNVWVLDKSYTGTAATDGSVYCYHASNIAAGSTTITTTGTAGTSAITLSVLEIANLASSTSLDSAGASSAGATTLAAAATTGAVSKSCAYVIGYAHDWWNNSTWTNYSGYSIKTQVWLSSGKYLGVFVEQDAKFNLTGQQLFYC